MPRLDGKSDPLQWWKYHQNQLPYLGISFIFPVSSFSLTEHFGTSSFISTLLFYFTHHLAILARKYLGIPASQASCERIFSITKNDITENRTCIKPELAQSLLMLRKKKDIF